MTKDLEALKKRVENSARTTAVLQSAEADWTNHRKWAQRMYQTVMGLGDDLHAYLSALEAAEDGTVVPYGVTVDENTRVTYYVEAPNIALASQMVLSMTRDERIDLEHEVEEDTDAVAYVTGPEGEVLK